MYSSVVCCPALPVTRGDVGFRCMISSSGRASANALLLKHIFPILSG